MKMTKCIVLGKQPKQEEKPIEFIWYISDVKFYNGKVKHAERKPKCFKNIELIKKGNKDEYDTMFAYTECRETGNLYLGHWNSGRVE